MRLKLTILLVLSLVLLILGCSSSNTVNSIMPTETGSATLLVNADVEGIYAGAGLFTTSFTVTLLDTANAPVINAAVSITHSMIGATNLTWDTLTSTYTASSSGFEPGLYTLNIVRGTDYLYNGRVYGPDIHTITFPTLSDTIPLNTPITALWTRTTTAELVEVETRTYGPALSTSVGDTDDGSFMIPGSSAPHDDQFVWITRSNDVVLTRGLSGSTFRAAIRNSISPLIQR